MKITQNDVDKAFATKLMDGPWVVDNFLSDVEEIKNIIKKTLGLDLSTVEVICFWEWRSARYDATWLSLDPEKEIARWFIDFVKQHTDFECEKCDGEGWVWWNELCEYDGPAVETGQDDTKYTCDRCDGKGEV